MDSVVDKTRDNLERWCSTSGINFQSPEAERFYKERARRIADVVQLKIPDRVPVVPSFGSFPVFYHGYTGEEGMFDPIKTCQAFKNALLDFMPDVCVAPGFANGPFYEAIDYRPLLLPGRGVPANAGFQFVEAEYITAEDFYDHFLDDPSDFMLRVFLPRVSGVMQPLKQLRPLHECFSYYLGIGPNVARLPLPDIESALEKLKEAGKIAVELNRPIESFENFALSMGFPIFHGGGTAAPYDVIGDFIRGTRGVMLDMYRRPDKLLAAMNKMVPYLIDMGLQAKDRRGCFVGIPLHKHSEGFMSQEQFRTFFWPSLKKVMLGLIEEGLVPVPFFEGETTARLEVIRDIPPGKAIYHFQNVNLYKARDALAGVVCFEGNVPASLLCTGTPEQVELYVKDLIDIFGRNCGLILNSGSVMDTARYDNVKAMFEFARKYGVYN